MSGDISYALHAMSTATCAVEQPPCIPKYSRISTRVHEPQTLAQGSHRLRAEQRLPCRCPSSRCLIWLPPGGCS